MSSRWKSRSPDSTDESDVDEAQTADWIMDLHNQGDQEDQPAGQGADGNAPIPSAVALSPVAADAPNQSQGRPQRRRAAPRSAGARRLPGTLPSAAQSYPCREWMVPLGIEPEKLFGRNGDILHNIEQQTNTYLRANQEPPAVFMWGTEEQINEAVRSLEIRASHLLDEMRASQRRTEGWAKPEKPKRKVKRERKERNDYQRAPPPDPVTTGVFILPEVTWPKWLKDADGSIRKLREDTRCWIFHEDGEDGGLMRIVGERPADVEVALSRLKNLYIQRTFKMKLFDRNLLECPTDGPNAVFRLIKAPECLTRYLNFRSQSELMVLRRMPPEEIPADFPEVPITADQMQKVHLNDLSDCFKGALEEVRLWQGQSRLRISFGHMIYTDYPEPGKYPYWRSGRLAARVFPNAAFKARFIHPVAEREHQAERFVRFLNDTCAEYMSNPRDTFELLCCDRAGAGQCDKALRDGAEMPPQFELSRVVAHFHKDTGRLTNWDAENICQTVLLVQHANTNSPLDWKLEMDTSIPLPADNKTPHGVLSCNLRLHSDRSRGDRLVFHHTSSLAVLQISRRRTWTYGHGDWIISVIRVDDWPSVAPVANRGDVLAGNIDPQCTLKETPLRSSVTVQLQHHLWDEELSSQLKLGPGEPARWDTEALAGREACNAMLAEINRFDNEIRRYVELVA